MKQRQANVQEARSAREMAEDSAEQTKESIKQGRTIMVFTVVTIIFVSVVYPPMIQQNAKQNQAPSIIHSLCIWDEC